MKHIYTFQIAIEWAGMGIYTIDIYTRNKKQAKLIAKSQLTDGERIISIRRYDNESEV